MRLPLVLLLALSCCFPLLAKDFAMKKAQKEGEKTAKTANSSQADKLCGQEAFEFTDQDLLSDSDKEKTFDAEGAEKNYKQAPQVAESSSLQGFLLKTKKSEKVEENEKFLVDSHTITKNSQTFSDIASLQTTIVPEEEILEKCQESGSYQISFEQTLTVQATPEVKQNIRHCNGHKKKKSYQSHDKAEEKKIVKQEKLKKNTEIASYDVQRDGRTITSSWKHKDNANSCDAYHTEEKVTQEAKEEDFWNANDPEGLSLVESNPSCKLLRTQFSQDPETRIINGKAVHRNVWFRQLFFSCEPSVDSKCAKLRAQGGVLVSKKCLIQNDLGECDLWEKTYDLGKRGAYQQTKASFQGDPIWGLDEFDTATDKNTDFGSVITALSIFSDMENSFEANGTDFNDKLKIFNGEMLKCQKSFAAGNVFDCCKEMDGLAVNVKLASCSDEEKCLAENRKRGKCHFIGTRKVKLGTVTEHVFCCFPTKLARVVHEQGRKQLGIEWGSADHPKCRGFSLSELQQIDFGKIDLSEVIDDLKIDKAAYKGSLEGSIESLKAQVQQKIEQKRQEVPATNPKQ